jgi:hypothetical protein
MSLTPQDRTGTVPAQIDHLYQKMVSDINQLKNESQSNLVSGYAGCIEIIRCALEQLHRYFTENPIEAETDRIAFFKKIKPRFYSLLIYYHELYRIEIHRPPGGKKVQKAYQKKNLKAYYAFFRQESAFLLYYQSGATDRDPEFFLPGKQPVSPFFNPLFQEGICGYTSPCDDRMARVLAYENLIDQIEYEMEAFNKSPTVPGCETPIKLNTSLSVAQLACLLRLLHEENILCHPNQTEALQFFARHFATDRTDQISSVSLRTKYYNVDRSTAESVKDLLFQMVNRLRKI